MRSHIHRLRVKTEYIFSEVYFLFSFKCAVVCAIAAVLLTPPNKTKIILIIMPEQLYENRTYI